MYSIWAIPSDKHRQYLSQIIQELSNTFNTCKFQPHCTLWSRIDLPLKKLIPVVKSSSHGIAPFTVKVKEIDHSQLYDKTLFIQLHNHENLSLLQQRIQNGVGKAYHYQFDPHVSLIYKDGMSENEKLNIADSLSIKSIFEIENIVINKTGNQIEKWKVVYKQKLKR